MSVSSANLMYKGSDADALRDVVINCDVVEKKLSSLREDKAAGVNGLMPRFKILEGGVQRNLQNDNNYFQKNAGRRSGPG